MTHLGTQISALADGQLSPANTERALCHVAACAECAAELAATRAARAALITAMDVPMAQNLTPRLLALGTGRQEPCAGGPGGGAGGGSGGGLLREWRQKADGAARRRATAPSSQAGSVPLPGSHPPDARDSLEGELGRRGSPGRSLTAVVVGIAAVWLFAVGEVRGVIPERRPAQVLAILAAADGPRTDVGSAAMTVREVARRFDEAAGPAGLVLADGYRVTGAHEDPTGVELDLDGPYGTVVVTQQPGRLDMSVAAAAPLVSIGGYDVHLLSSAPWHVVWQSGERVVGVVAGGVSPAVEAVVAACPPEPFDDGVVARFSRGWTVVTGGWNR